MPSSIDNFASLVDQTLYPLILDEYAAEPVTYPQICEILPWDTRYNLGERTDAVVGVDEPDEVIYGQEAPDRQFLDGWKVYSKARKFAHKMGISREELDAINSAGRLPGSIEQFFLGQGAAFARKKEKHIAGMLQKGTLTAGSYDYFDGSFTGEADPYPTVIYDGQPFFDTAHNLKGTADTTPSNHPVSAALSEANIQAALTLMERTSAVDERGYPIVNRMDTLMVPVGLEWTARTLLESVLKPGSGNNDKNLLQGRLGLIINRHITDDADCWYLFNTMGRRAIRVRDSGEPRFRVFTDERLDMVYIELSTQFMAAVQNWRSAFNANKAAA